MMRTLGDMLLAVTAADTDAVDNVALLGLVAKTAGLVGAGRARGAVDDVELAVLPAPMHEGQIWPVKIQSFAMYAPHTEEESKNIRLLLFVELANVLVSPHCEL